MEADHALQRFAGLADHADADLRLDVGALEIARLADPDLDPAPWLSRLDGLAERSRSSLRGVKAVYPDALSHVLFHLEGFRGNSLEYGDPRNSYLHHVLQRRLGIPITLAVVFLEVSRRLGYRAQGVGLPGHFLVQAESAGRSVLVDPFHGGRAISVRECRAWIEDNSGGVVRFQRRYLAPVGTRAILARMLRNLKGVFLGHGNRHLALRAADRLVLLHPGDAAERRDRGRLRLLLDDLEGGCADLDAYLEAAPRAPDREAVLVMLRQARRRQTQWN